MQLRIEYWPDKSTARWRWRILDTEPASWKVLSEYSTDIQDHEEPDDAEGFLKELREKIGEAEIVRTADQ